MADAMTLSRWRARLLAEWPAVSIWLGLWLSYNYEYYFRIQRPVWDLRLSVHRSIVLGMAEAPYQFRWLMPVLVEAAIQLLDVRFDNYRYSFLLAYSAFTWVITLAVFAAFYAWLRGQFDPVRALAGVAVFAALLYISFYDYTFHPWSWFELLSWLLALLLIQHQRHGWLGVLILIAGFNRETVVFMPLLHLALTLPWSAALRPDLRAYFASGHWRWTAAYGVLALIGPVTLRLAYPDTPPSSYTFAYVWALNGDPYIMRIALLRIFIFLGGLLLLATVAGWRQAHPYLRRVWWVLALYLAPIAVFGIWGEVRLYWVFYPFIIPLALAALPPTSNAAHV